MINAYLVITAILLLPIVAGIIAALVINAENRRERIAEQKHQKRLADIRNGNTPDAIAHRQYMERMAKIEKENQAKFDAIVNCPKYKKLQDEINREYFAMVKGRDRHNAMMQEHYARKANRV